MKSMREVAERYLDRFGVPDTAGARPDSGETTAAAILLLVEELRDFRSDLREYASNITMAIYNHRIP
jgi:hypothetical protein